MSNAESATATSSAPVLFETIRTDSGFSFGRATLNASGTLNALSLAMVDLIDPQLRAWAADPQIAVVVLDAVGDKAFCAGGDVVGVQRAIRATAPGEVPAEAAAFFEREYRLDYRIHQFPKPILCWGHGIVMGGGIGLMAGASHRVVTTKTRMAMPEINIGLYPDVGGSWFLPRVPGRAGMFLALSGAPLNASDACHAGLADAVLRHEDLGPLLHAMSKAKWKGEVNYDGAQLSFLIGRAAAGVELPVSQLQTHRTRIESLASLERLERIAPRFVALSNDSDPWLANAGKSFAKGSPTSAGLALELQRRAQGMSLPDVFRLELQASIGCCMHNDFAEGVRALLIDKDKSPNWQPSTWDAVTPELIEAHLKPHYTGAHPLADLA